LFWNAVNTDPALLDAAGQRVKQVLESGTELRITATNGTDVTVQVGNRPVLISDGAISPAEEQTGGAATTIWLPAGEVFVTPVPGTASGTVVFDAFEFQGTPVEGLTLTFENGRLTSMNATAGLAPVQAAYDAASAGKDEFAVIDIGLNPNVTVTADSRFRSWVAAGIVSVGIGDNVWAGGSNSTPYGLFGHIAGATVTVDGNAVVENGRLAN
jgi:leucyl aminopeptidase (aminopeptidase T)